MSKTSARSIADVTKRSILARVEVAAAPERVWKAITLDVAAWWGSDELYRTTKHTVDLRPGGAYRSDGMGADGHAFHVTGEVLEVDPPRKYVTTWQPSWSSEPASKVTYLLEAIATGTRVTVEHSGFTNAETCEDHGTGWVRVLDWLDGHLRAKPSYFFMRLIPPRATFPADATPAELAAMKAHSDYWRGKIAEGVGVIAGPVADPERAYGIGVVAAADAAQVAAFEDADPVISAGLGFRYEHHPMPALLF
ncbi:MAG TPA: SRPBCC domain-containing protein [Kofleriaceae bacterium]|jgi:uncharacterized protein YndB with AHSA1/START domain